MLKTLIVSEDDIGKLQGMTKMQISDMLSLSEADIPALVEEHRPENATDFVINKDKFACQINSQKEQYAFFSVPYDHGWRATVNGKETEIIKVNGLMAIPVEAGNNLIEFYYFDRLLFASGLISILSLGILAFYMYRTKNKIEKV